MIREDEIYREAVRHASPANFKSGADWADAHPVNPWHKVSEELPKEGKHILMAHTMRNGDYMIEAIWYPEPQITDDMEYWMEIPEIKED